MPAPTLRESANALRVLSMDAVEQAKSGHPGMPMGMADAALVLFARAMKFSAAHPDWPDRDRFVLSAGHGSMLLYGILHLVGVAEMTIGEIRRFRQLGAKTAGHPEFGAAPGIETTTGPLGQGLANAAGMALAERVLNAEFGNDLVNHRVWCVAGDGCLMEGISHEAASLAGHLKLARLNVLFDDNRISIDGPTSLAVGDDHRKRFEAQGWHTTECDAHDFESVGRALDEASAADRPSLICCRSTIGFGAPKKAGTAAAHGSPLGPDECAEVRKALGWKHPPFEIPDDILQAWRDIGKRGDAAFSEWQSRLESSPRKDEFLSRVVNNELPSGWDSALREWEKTAARERPKMATRAASGEALKRLLPSVPALVGGSADLTGSNNTKVGDEVLSAGKWRGYIHYGVREHAMAAAMNGMALHGGVIPYGGTFLVFSDYCRPAIRLSALTGRRVVYVMTHDSIGLGEDGPTHQPVEHLRALRCVPNLRVLRPCDVVETAECWRMALERKDGPTLLALSRQGLPGLRESAGENLCAKGGYVLAQAGTESGTDSGSGPESGTASGLLGKRDVTLAASGSEVAIAMAARELLRADGVQAAVVSVPCLELFAEQADDYIGGAVPHDIPLVVCEAALPDDAWRRFAGRVGFVGVSGFGESAPADEVYRHFGITPEKVAELAREMKS